jgi:succinylarginine dihydrolase
MMTSHEVNFDGIVGPTHNYAGLSHGNVASQKHGLTVSRPKDAALQGLAKMKYLADLGLKQAVLPPQRRPHFPTLRRLGFHGTDAQMLESAWREHRRLVAGVYSASSMWAANAATIAPSRDTGDGRVHFTPANLITQFHRSIEVESTAAVLKQIFADEAVFAHHPPLPATAYCADEGAANHTRLYGRSDLPGIEVFVYGRDADPAIQSPARFPARQTHEASLAIARLHQLKPALSIFLRQSPQAIDAGAFHNDVVAVGNQNVFLCHASAYAHNCAALGVSEAFEGHFNEKFNLIEVPEEQLSLAAAIQTYLFNSQLVTLPSGEMSLIAPIECQEHADAEAVIRGIIAWDNPIKSVHYLDVRQSMKNGGGPACLRLRVMLSESELARVHPGVLLTPTLYSRLVDWVERRYREQIAPEDLADPQLARESNAALDELEQILHLQIM